MKTTFKDAKPRFSDVQTQFLEAIELGFTFPEAMAMVGVNAGHIGAWKRWTDGFAEVLERSRSIGIPLRRMLKSIEWQIDSNGDRFIPSEEIQTLLDARARACAGAGGRVRTGENAHKTGLTDS